MILDQYIIKILLTLDGYIGYRGYIDKKGLNSGVKQIVTILDKVYKSDTQSITTAELQAMLLSEYPSMGKAELAGFEVLFKGVDEINLDNSSTELVLTNYKNTQVAVQLGKLSTDYINDPSKFDIEKLKKICEDYERTIKEEEDPTLKTFDIDYLLDERVKEVGIYWPWERFNEILGPMTGSGLYLMFGVPETGKSAFCHTAATHFASQGRVLFINNEEAAERVYMRAMSCWTEMTEEEAKEDKEEFMRRWDYIKDNYIYRDDVNLTISKLKKYIEKDKPRVIFIDQAVKIKVESGDRHDLTLTNIFKELREVVKTYDNIDIVGISQADAKAYGVKYLQMKHLANSKIGIQGELDVMIGASRPNDGDFMYFSFPKNKNKGISNLRGTLQLNRGISKLMEIQ